MYLALGTHGGNNLLEQQWECLLHASLPCSILDFLRGITFFKNTNHGFSAIADSLMMSLLFGSQMATSENQNKPLPNSERTLTILVDCDASQKSLPTR